MGRPRALLILGRLQVGLLLICAFVLLGAILLGWAFSGWHWPRDAAAELFLGLGALVLGGIWLAATRPAWHGDLGPLLTVAALTLPAAIAAGVVATAHGVLAVPFATAILPVAVLVLGVRRWRHHRR